MDTKDDIEFMQIDCDYYTSPGKWILVNCAKLTTCTESGQDGGKPIIRMFGVTENGNSVAAHVHNFTAYFYVHVIEQQAILGPVEIENFREKLNKSVQSGHEAVVQIEQVDKYPCMNFQQDKQKFLKIYVSHPRFVSQLRAVVEKGI